jgi:hypothetical protein|nr:MAG TPA: Minor capsid protein [Caudoviricetes sp.]
MAIKLKFSIYNKAEDKIKEILELEVNAKLNEIEEAVVPLTPVGKSIEGRTEKNPLVRKGLARPKKGYTGGNLREGWNIIPAKLNGRRIVGYIYNSVEYAGHVNYGHRTRLGTSEIKRGAKSKAFGKHYIEGVYFVEEALIKVGLRKRLVKKKAFYNARRIK